MKKALLVLVMLLTVIVPESFAQTPRRHRQHQGSHSQQQIITKRIAQTMRMHQRLQISELLQLSSQQERKFDIVSLSIVAQSFRGQAQINLLSHGQIVSTQILKRQMKEVHLQVPNRSQIEALELFSAEDIFIESISAQVIKSGQASRLPKPQPNAMLTVSVNQMVRGMAQIPLKKLVKQQLGLSLKGVEIQRVVVEGSPSRWGRSASVQVELNNRLIGPAKFLSSVRDRVPLPLNSFEKVQSLQLIVHGDAHIQEINIRVGQVRGRNW